MILFDDSTEVMLEKNTNAFFESEMAVKWIGIITATIVVGSNLVHGFIESPEVWVPFLSTLLHSKMALSFGVVRHADCLAITVSLKRF